MEDFKKSYNKKNQRKRITRILLTAEPSTTGSDDIPSIFIKRTTSNRRLKKMGIYSTRSKGRLKKPQKRTLYLYRKSQNWKRIFEWIVFLKIYLIISFILY